MKITFDRLTVGDKIFCCYSGDMQYQTKKVERVESSDFYFGYGDKCPRFKNESTKEIVASWRDNRNTVIFCNETDAIRYCKAQLMKNLFSIEKSARDAVKALHNFRSKHFELLNHSWTERSIQELEKQLG